MNIKNAAMMMAIGSAVTLGVKKYADNSDDINKSIKKMVKENMKTLETIKDKI